MQTIYKYPLEMEDEQTLSLPMGAKILSVQTQRETPCIWALVDIGSNLPFQDRVFILRGTGHPINESSLLYIGTFQLENGEFIFHLFEKIKRL
jgi:hypothetical protein